MKEILLRIQRMILESGNCSGHALGKLMIIQLCVLGIITLLHNP